MNCAAATAFLPNFVGFPSPRGLHSSTVQRRRAPGARTCPPTVVGRRARFARWDTLPSGVRTHSPPESGRVPFRNLGRVPFPGLGHVPSRSSAAPCQLPPPHPPPPHEDPPPQDEPPHDECPPQECPPPWWPPDEPPDEQDDAAPPAPPAHQLLSPPLPLREERRPLRPPTTPVDERPLPFFPPPTTPMITTSRTTARMMPMTMASPSFRSPEAAPRGPCFSVPALRDRGMPARFPPQSRVEEVQSIQKGDGS